MKRLLKQTLWVRAWSLQNVWLLFFVRPSVIEFPLPMSLLMRFVRLVPNALYELATAPAARRKIDPAKVKR